MADDASTRFPFISLDKALHRAQQLFQGDRTGKAMPIPVAFELWGYSPKSSGAFQTVGALKGYGLIDDEGANADRRIRLTDAARRYFLDERDEVRANMIADFALKPPLFRALWTNDRWCDGIPADTVARSHLKIDRKLNDQSARSLLSIFKENIQFAGLQAGSPREAAIDPPIVESTSKPDTDMDKGRETSEGMSNFSAPPIPPSPLPSGATKPIIFDMESVTVSARFDNVEDLRDFISKLQKLEPLMPSKA